MIIDKSASMKLAIGRWKQAKQALKILITKVLSCDADGITLYFFSSHQKSSKEVYPAFNKYENVTSTKEVARLFSAKENQPKGGTDFTSVLQDAMSSLSKPTSILMITDGIPDDPKSSEALIV